MGGVAMLWSIPLLLSLSQSQGQRSNSEGSSCRQGDERRFCNCSSGNLHRVPAVTPDVVNLDLSFNDIMAVAEDDLRAYVRLETLTFRSNRIRSVHGRAFHFLSRLESLDLSSNQLTHLATSWFSTLHFLQHLNLLENPYKSLGPGQVFQPLASLRSLKLGGPALEELRTGHLAGVRTLNQLVVHGNNLKRYDPGSLADVWPIGVVTLSLRRAFQEDLAMASAVLRDVSYPDTSLVLSDLSLTGNTSYLPFIETRIKRVRSMTFRNISLSDEWVINFLKVTDGAPLAFLGLEDVAFTGQGAWAKAGRTHHESLDTVVLRNIRVLDVYKFSSLLQLFFLLPYPRQVSVIGSKVFVMPCVTSHLLVSLQYLDLSSNLLTDLTMTESLCGGHGTLQELRVLNVSGNALKSLSLMTRLVARLARLTHLDLSHNAYASMPDWCSWPPSLRFLNVSWAKLRKVTPCLPVSLEVLDLSHNDLAAFHVALPGLRQLLLSGNKFLRLPPGWLFPSLEVLSIQSNTLNMFTPADLQQYRRLARLQAGRNKFVCSCEFVWFLGGAVGGAVAVRGVEGGVELTDGLESYICDSPLALQGQRAGRVRLPAVHCHRILVVSVLCGTALLTGILTGILLWKLHAVWYLRMMWAWLGAKRSSVARREAREEFGYDAFVSYSERDARWVEEFLVLELEDSQPPLSLCLHKRDFLPGQWILDNIINAMENSRRTLFILSQHFVHSDWCRYELDFSHFRLFDGREDTAILVLLEPISQADVPRRFCKLRKFMSSRTYLEWPEDEERRPEFWNNLRLAIRGEEP